MVIQEMTRGYFVFGGCQCINGVTTGVSASPDGGTSTTGDKGQLVGFKFDRKKNLTSLQYKTSKFW